MIFDCIDADLVTLSNSMQKRCEKETVLAESSKKQEKNLEEVFHHLAALENREEEREMRITLQEDLIQQLQDELVVVQGKVCCCHERPVAGGHILEGSSNLTEEEEGLKYASKRSYTTPPTVPLELEDIIAQDTLRFSTPPIEEQEGVRECCWTRVVEYMDDLVEIADDERSGSSSSSESSSSPGTSLPELEDQENRPPVNYGDVNSIAIPVPPPVGHPPPDAMSGQ